MKDSKVKIIVVSAPEYVVCECPHCKEEVQIEYNEFLDAMPGEYYEDWIDEKIECPDCGGEIEVKYVDWD